MNDVRGRTYARGARTARWPTTNHAGSCTWRTPAIRPSSTWLEPYGGDPTWRQQMWGQIVALHGRYPRALAPLNDNWWKDDSQTETLCALAVWRAEIDDTGIDPRDELAFQTQLTDLFLTLRQQGGGVTKTWTPGAPPAEWAAG